MAGNMRKMTITIQQVYISSTNPTGIYFNKNSFTSWFRGVYQINFTFRIIYSLHKIFLFMINHNIRFNLQIHTLNIISLIWEIIAILYMILLFLVQVFQE